MSTIEIENKLWLMETKYKGRKVKPGPWRKIPTQLLRFKTLR